MKEVRDVAKRLRHFSEHPSLISWTPTSEVAFLMARAADLLDGCVMERSSRLNENSTSFTPTHYIEDDVV